VKRIRGKEPPLTAAAVHALRAEYTRGCQIDAIIHYA
jgi:hypothetical protein